MWETIKSSDTPTARFLAAASLIWNVRSLNRRAVQDCFTAFLSMDSSFDVANFNSFVKSRNGKWFLVRGVGCENQSIEEHVLAADAESAKIVFLYLCSNETVNISYLEEVNLVNLAGDSL